MTYGDELLRKIILGRHVAYQYKLENYTVASLNSITKSLNAARRELLNEIYKRDIILPSGREDKVLHELNDMTLAIQYQLTGNIQEASTVAGEYSYKEYNNILSFDGRLKETVGFNTVSLSASQLKAMVVDVPVGGKLLNKWVSDNFERQIIDEIQTDIMAGMFKGDSTKKLVDRLRDSFDVLDRDAITLTRTYVSSINNRAAEEVYMANSDIIDRVEWSATLEVSRIAGRGTCLSCSLLDGQSWPLDADQPSAPLHPRCVTGDSIIFAPDVTHLMESRYTGPIVKLFLSGGGELSVTPNHMLMTEHGLVMARFLTDRDNLLHCVDFEGPSFGDPNDNRNNLRIDNIIKSFSKSLGVVPSSVPMSPEYFHGDGVFGNKDINVIDANSFLRDGINTEFVKHFSSESFAPIGFTSLLPAYGDITLFFKRYLAASHLLVGFSREFFSFCQWCSRHTERHGVTPVSCGDTIIFEKFDNWRSACSDLFGDLFDRKVILEESDNFFAVKIKGIVVRDWDYIKANFGKSALNRFTFESGKITKPVHRHTTFMKFIKFCYIKFRPFNSVVRSGLFTKGSNFYGIFKQRIPNGYVGNATFQRNMCDRIPLFVKSYYLSLIQRLALAYRYLLGVGSEFNPIIRKQKPDSAGANRKVSRNFYGGLPLVIKLNDFIKKRLNSFNRFFPKLKAIVCKHFTEVFPVKSSVFCDSGNTLPGNIKPMKISDIKIIHVIDLPVYDVSTLSTSYIVNGVLSSNCRCFKLPQTKSYKELGLDIPEIRKAARPFTEVNGIPVDEGGKRKILDFGMFQGNAREFIESKGPVYMKNVLGPGRYNLIKSGDIKWGDLLDKDGNVRLLKKGKEGGYIGLQ